jgi:hypothetical protein
MGREALMEAVGGDASLRRGGGARDGRVGAPTGDLHVWSAGW